MSIYEVTFDYKRSGHRRVVGSVKIIAENAGLAREAFTATHPAGAEFTYAILNILPTSL